MQDAGADGLVLFNRYLDPDIDLDALQVQPPLTQVLDGMTNWLETGEYASVEQAKGSMSWGNCPDPGALQRANSVKALISFTSQE